MLALGLLVGALLFIIVYLLRSARETNEFIRHFVNQGTVDVGLVWRATNLDDFCRREIRIQQGESDMGPDEIEKELLYRQAVARHYKASFWDAVRIAEKQGWWVPKSYKQMLLPGLGR